jgi:hypothetical protein
LQKHVLCNGAVLGVAEFFVTMLRKVLFNPQGNSGSVLLGRRNAGSSNLEAAGRRVVSVLFVVWFVYILSYYVNADESGWRLFVLFLYSHKRPPRCERRVSGMSWRGRGRARLRLRRRESDEKTIALAPHWQTKRDGMRHGEVTHFQS